MIDLEKIYFIILLNYKSLIMRFLGLYIEKTSDLGIDKNQLNSLSIWPALHSEDTRNHMSITLTRKKLLLISRT